MISTGEAVDALIPLLCGVWMTLVGFGYLGNVPGTTAHRLRQQYGTVLKILGPLGVMAGLVMLLRAASN